MRLQLHDRSLEEFDAAKLSDDDLDKFRELNLSSNRLRVVSGLQRFLRVTILSLSHNSLQTIVALPPQLRVLSVAHNRLSNLAALSKLRGLEQLDVSHNLFTLLPPLPDSLRSLNASDNQLIGMSQLPPALMKLNLAGNPNLAIDVLPGSLRHLILPFTVTDAQAQSIAAMCKRLVSLNGSEFAPRTSRGSTSETRPKTTSVCAVVIQRDGPAIAALWTRVRALESALQNAEKCEAETEQRVSMLRRQEKALAARLIEIEHDTAVQSSRLEQIRRSKKTIEAECHAAKRL